MIRVRQLAVSGDIDESLLSAELAADHEQRLRFEREARSASALSHPNVCTIHEIGEANDDRPFLAMEYIEGRTLKDRLDEGAVSIAEVVDILIQVSDALDNVHVGFDGYNRRIEALRQRILALLPRMQASRDNASEQLQQLALQELETRRQRLASYRIQARYALARSYDLIAQQSGEQP